MIGGKDGIRTLGYGRMREFTTARAVQGAVDLSFGQLKCCRRSLAEQPDCRIHTGIKLDRMDGSRRASHSGPVRE